MTVNQLGVHRVGPDWNILITLGSVAMTFYTDIQSPQRMNPTEFGDSLTFATGRSYTISSSDVVHSEDRPFLETKFFSIMSVRPTKPIFLLHLVRCT